jgi:hypothetical protein
MGQGERVPMVDLETLFPGLRGSAYVVTSPPSEEYNCIAWASGDSARWWWPDLLKQRYWPEGVKREETLDAFREAFATLGFVSCQDAGVEPGVEKVAIYASADGPQHAARQLVNGNWTSKLGELQDIQHALHDLEGDEYGKVAFVIRRPIGHSQ